MGNKASVLKQHGYTQQEEIGQGQFGKTLRVKNEKDGKDYAMKVVHDSERVMTEVTALKDLRHPFIVQYRDFFKDPDSLNLYIVMEYCDGGNLSEKIHAQKAKDGYFSEDQILSWFVEICLAVHHVHEKNILHRDIKPQNILLDEHGRTRLADFGVAKHLESGSAYAHTDAGTFCYLSPERIDDLPYNSKSDMWALGCVLYELCELRLAFPETRKTVLFKKITDGPSPEISDKYSTDLRDLVRDLLQKNPANRPSASDVLKRPFLLGSLIKKIIGAPEDMRQKLNKLNEVADALERVLLGTYIGSLAGGVVGAAGGITTIVGLILAPFTLGASLIVTGVGVGVAAAGGVTGAASNITNMVKERTDRSIMENFIQELEMKMVMLITCFQHIDDGFKDLEKDNPFDARPAAQAVKGTGGFAKLASAVQAFRAVSQGVRLARAAEVLTGVFAGLFLAVDIFFIVDDSMAIHAMRKQRSSATTEYRRQESEENPDEAPTTDPQTSSTAVGEEDSCALYRSTSLELLPGEIPDKAPSTDPQTSRAGGIKALKTREFIQEIRKATAEIEKWLEKFQPLYSAITEPEESTSLCEQTTVPLA
ncbi:hypothetical protein GJAV_G00155700 [Gymnothorax javanicus]|nr:hypothetical protein GJAV_G00155700 [Gymnothorax javanicus]